VLQQRTIVYIDEQHIRGEATPATERFRDQLRRYGIRFYSRPNETGQYEDWR